MNIQTKSVLSLLGFVFGLFAIMFLSEGNWVMGAILGFLLLSFAAWAYDVLKDELAEQLK